MTTVTKWLEAEAERLLLVTLVAQYTTHYVANKTWRTALADSPSNTVFEGLVTEAEIIWRMGAGLGFRGVLNASDLVVVNPDGDLDSWLSKEWKSITYRYGDPSWDYSDFIIIYEGHIDNVTSDDNAIIFELRDRYKELEAPIQQVFPVPSPSGATMYPVCYGHPRNVTPIVTEPDSTPEYRVSEPPCEDAAEQRYLNQAAFTSPGIAKNNSEGGFSLNSDPSGQITVDCKGKTVDGTYHETLGAALRDALTRTHKDESGILAGKGGASDTVQLPATSSPLDDHYNGKDLTKWPKADAAVGTTSTAQTKTITDYDGASRIATFGSNWTTDAAEGDPYKIAGEETQAGPLTDDDLDIHSFEIFDSEYPYEIGFYVDDDSTSAVELLDQALSPAAWHGWTTGVSGKSRFKVGLIKDPSTQTAAYSLAASEMHGNIERTQQLRRTKRLRVGHMRNWSFSGRGGGHDADAARQSFVDHEYRYVVRGSHAHGVDRELKERTINTFIADGDGVDAETEADRIWSLVSVQRQTYLISTFLKPLIYGLGAIVEVTDDRHELDAKNLLVTEITLLPLQGLVEMEAWG